MIAKQFSSFCQMPQPLNYTLHLSLLLCLFELMTIIVFLKLSCFAKWRHFFLHTCWLVFGTGIILDWLIFQCVLMNWPDLGWWRVGRGVVSRCLGVNPTLPAPSSKDLTLSLHLQSISTFSAPLAPAWHLDQFGDQSHSDQEEYLTKVSLTRDSRHLWLIDD